MNFSYYGAFTWMPSLLADQFGSRPESFRHHARPSSIAQLPGYFLAAWLVEVWGRRKTLSIFLAVSAVAAFAFSQAGSVALVLVFGMLLSASNLGAWGVLYAVTPEIYPTRLRGAAAGAAAAVGRIAAIIAPLLMPWFLTLSGGNKAVGLHHLRRRASSSPASPPLPARNAKASISKTDEVDDGRNEYLPDYRQNPRVPAKGTRGFCRLKAVKTAEIPRGVRRDAGVLPL